MKSNMARIRASRGLVRLSLAQFPMAILFTFSTLNFMTTEQMERMEPPQTKEDLRQSLAYHLGAFSRWMNEPLKRVHVYSWRLANQEFGNSNRLHLFRARRAYRCGEVNQIRFNVAQILKWRRSRKSITLPTYNEAKDEYQTP